MTEIQDFFVLWDELHQEHIKQGLEVRNKLTVEWCENQIMKAKKAYYETGNPIMSDAAYDKIESYLKILDQINKMLEKVGA
jgi:NAD-dependent DNA ligase